MNALWLTDYFKYKSCSLYKLFILYINILLIKHSTLTMLQTSCIRVDYPKMCLGRLHVICILHLRSNFPVISWPEFCVLMPSCLFCGFISNENLVWFKFHSLQSMEKRRRRRNIQENICLTCFSGLHVYRA